MLINCLVDDDPVFQVAIAINDTIFGLKKLVRKNGALHKDLPMKGLLSNT